MGLWKATQDALAPIFRPAGTLIEGINPGDWASAQQPIRPTQQLGVGVRQWDFTPGINLQFTPRSENPVKFGQLWNVSNSFDLCRLMIETRKDQIVNRPWQIRVKKVPGEKKAERLKREAQNKNVTAVTQLLRYPDGVHSFDLWIRMWLEDLLVFDAPTIYPCSNLLKEIKWLRLVSGATITPLLDNNGFRPLPPSPAYQQIILGIPTGNLTGQALVDAKKPKEFAANQLVYSPRNPRVNSRWGFPPVEQIIRTLAIAANRQQFLLDYYTSGNVPEGLLPMPENWTMQQIKDFQKWFDSLLAGNLGKRRRLTMIPDAKHPAQFSKAEALTDATDEYLIRVVAFAFSVSPQNLVKQVNRGTAKESTDVAQVEGLEPYLRHIENTLNYVIERVLMMDDVEFAYNDEREIDPAKQATVDEIYVKEGIYTRNEIREARGDDPNPAAEADMLCITTPTGIVPLAIEDATARSTALQPPKPEPTNPPQPAGPAKLGKRAELKAVAGLLTPRNSQLKQELHRKLAKFLSAQGARVAKGAGKAFAKKVRKSELEDDTARALAILAAMEWEYPQLAELVRPYLEEAAREGVSVGAYQATAHLQTNLKEVTDAATPVAEKEAAGRAYQMVGLKLEDDGTVAEATGAHWAISTTAKDDVLNAIKQAIKENWTSSQLEAVIQASTVFSDDKADQIADSEISHQQVRGHVGAWSASKKVLEYAWQVQDGGCCPICAEFSAQGSVPVGHDFGMGITEPGAHPECRCWLSATKFAGDEE